jgi:glutathione-specific gamma-glutamylcyclotransferase
MRRLPTPALTPELVARVHRVVEDPGPDPGVAYFTEEDYDLLAAALLAEAPGEVWLFAYGSLIWRPACEVAERRVGVVRGRHRSFCLKLTRFRGTKEQPGLMLALDRGGQCRGVALRLPAGQEAACLGQVMRREMTVKPPSNVPRWVEVRTPEGAVRALAFTMNRAGRAYAGKLPPEEVADILSKAVGHWGSGAEYLLQTVTHLAEAGIHDRNLGRLQRLVAERIAAIGEG